MASERLSVVVVFMVVMVMGAMHMQSSDAQTTHNVGGSIGWTIPTADANAYTTWAASQTFKVGDVLVFNYTTGTHTAAEVVTKAAYDACTTSNPISVWSNGPSSVTLNSSGAHYYLCTITGHCQAGQKLAITVAAAASPAPAPAPTPTPTPSATPPTPTPSPTPAHTPTPTPTPSPNPSTTPSPTPTPTPTPASSPSRTPESAPVPSGTPSSPPAPGSRATPSGPAPGASDTPDSPSSASFLSAALPVTFLSVAMALYY